MGHHGTAMGLHSSAMALPPANTLPWRRHEGWHCSATWQCHVSYRGACHGTRHGTALARHTGARSWATMAALLLPYLPGLPCIDVTLTAMLPLRHLRQWKSQVSAKRPPIWHPMGPPTWHPKGRPMAPPWQWICSWQCHENIHGMPRLSVP